MPNKLYMAVGEEATRGTAQSATVGFVPLSNPSIPDADFKDESRKEYRGEDSQKGDFQARRNSQGWTSSLNMPFYTEAGTVKGIMGTILKHFFGGATSAQNATTGQYLHMMSERSNPFAAANLGDKALTLNLNLNEGDTMRLWPFIGGRLKSLTFNQETGSQLIVIAEIMGQRRGSTASEIGTVVMPAEALRCDYPSFKLWTGTITRTGTGPNFTQFAFGSATAIKPDKFTCKIDAKREDIIRLSGLNYPDVTRCGKFEVTMEFTIDFSDPAAGFSAVDDINSWFAALSETNFCAQWDTGTQAGTGDNHMLILDLPRMLRLGGKPEYDLEKDPMVTLKYRGLVDITACQYLVGCMLKNTATTV
jgi:hypothetical protein